MARRVGADKAGRCKPVLVYIQFSYRFVDGVTFVAGVKNLHDGAHGDFYARFKFQRSLEVLLILRVKRCYERNFFFQGVFLTNHSHGERGVDMNDIEIAFLKLV